MRAYFEGDLNLTEFSGGNGVSHVIVDEGKLCLV